ncbi:addiction module antidote protein [Mesorhizobium xinjiangense]|uniref:addiction module antidote protein n=1 Tax=Mesorhizobium xinjiangense TaxID=2678685 RepID=UPI0012EDCA30|nr:addiction module antidote protein [Mesorhizobium xinjiangense]
MTFESAPYDSAEFLEDDEAIAAYLEEAFATNDPAFILKALGTVARARSMSRLAEETGMSRTSLYKALSGEGRPEFATILKVARALGLDMTVKPHMPDAA